MKTSIGKIVTIIGFVVLGFTPTTWAATKFLLGSGAVSVGSTSADHETPIGIFTQQDANGVQQVFMSQDNGSDDITVKQVTTSSENKTRPLFVPESSGTTVVVLNADVAETKTCDGPVIVYLVDVSGTGQLRGACIPSDWTTTDDVTASADYHVFNITETLLKNKDLVDYDITSPVTVIASLEYSFAAASGTLEFKRDYHQIAYTQKDGSLNYLLVDFTNVQVDYTHIDEVADYFWMINNAPSSLSIGNYGASMWSGIEKSGLTDVSQPRFSLNGDRIYFLQNVSGNNQLGVIPVRGMTATQITAIEGNVDDITPLPKGNVAFTLNTGGLNELGVIYVSIEQSTIVSFCSTITAFSDPAFASQHPALVHVPAASDSGKGGKGILKGGGTILKLLQNMNINNHPYVASRMLAQAAAAPAIRVAPAVTIDRFTPDISKVAPGAVADAATAATSEDGVGIMYDRVDTTENTNLYYTWLTEDQLACSSMAAEGKTGKVTSASTVTNITTNHYAQTCDQINEVPHSYYPSNKDASFVDRTDTVTTPQDVIYRRTEGGVQYPVHLHDITTTAPDCSVPATDTPAATTTPAAEAAPSEEAAAAVAPACSDEWSTKQISYSTYRGLVTTGSTATLVSFTDGTQAYAKMVDGELYYDALATGDFCGKNAASDGAYGSGLCSLRSDLDAAPFKVAMLVGLLFLGNFLPQLARRSSRKS